MPTLEDAGIYLEVNEKDGSVSLLRDKSSGLTFASGGAEPFRINLGGDEFLTPEHTFTYSAIQGGGLALSWTFDGMRLSAELRIIAGELRITSYLENSPGSTVYCVEYPIIGGIGRVADDDAMAHPFATGFEIDSPAESFAEDWRGIRFAPYPESFSGASMQFMSYYSKSLGGLYLAAHDGTYGHKWLNFYKRGGAMEFSVMYGFEMLVPGADLAACWPTVVAFTGPGGWYPAADKYKAWAVGQEWCRRGRLADCPDDKKPKWLLENVGMTTFGITASYDRSKWIKKYRELVGAPVFHVLGPDWTDARQDFGANIPGGYEDWAPTRFHQKNLESIRENGDYFAPFEFDFLVSNDKSDAESIKAAHAKWIKPSMSIDWYDFYMLCAACRYTRELHIARDARVQRDASVDAMYYDISAANLRHYCMRSGHGHTPGGGRSVTRAYRDIYRETSAKMSAGAGKYIPVGTEMMCEVFLDVVDYYQARAGGRPCSSLEGGNFGSLINRGKARLIPMFTYVYHEYGAVRMDGWGKLTAEIGELFYHSVAQIYLWGGLYELNYEYSPMEKLDGSENDPKEHYYEFIPRGFELDEERARYIGQFARLRVGEGNKYLAYGTMKRPPKCECSESVRPWYHYNHDPGSERRGEYAVKDIVASAWEYGGKTAIFVANTSKSEKTFTLEFDISDYGFSSDARASSLNGSLPDIIIAPGKTMMLKMTLPPLSVDMISLS